MLPLVCAHRCRVGLDRPENTLAALEEAISLGVDMVELDARAARDGMIVAYHDRRAPDGRPVAELSWEELRAQLPGVVPVVALLEASAGRVRVNLDLKDRQSATVVEHALELDSERLIVTGLSRPAQVRALRRRYPAAQIGLGAKLRRDDWSGLALLSLAQLAQADLISADYRLLRAGLGRRAAKAGLPLYVWTVNRERDLRRLVNDERLAGVITDRAELALALRER